ncbi:MAG TPA: DUF438 domain-containing protein [Bacteroidetes bacterium]|nr:DUF438 domain-containing protein [Bacteroidota bacterium]
MQEKRWDEILVGEHEMIERAMDVLQREIDKLPFGDIDIFSVRRAVDFLFLFGDTIHNKKEEEYLFPLLMERGIPKDGPIRVMLLEHDMERKLLVELNDEAPSLTKQPEREKIGFKEKVFEYLNIRANHIWKENDVLYNMGRRVFSEEDNRCLVENFTGLNREHYGDEAEDQFNRMLDEVEQGGKARKSLIHNLTYEQIDAIMETLPIEVTFVDADDMVAYFNRLDKEKIFVRTRSVVSRKVQKCHPEKSLHVVQKIIDGFKNGTMDEAEFWIDFMGDKVHIRYFPVRDDEGNYLGALETTQKIGNIQKLTGEKKLLDD